MYESDCMYVQYVHYVAIMLKEKMFSVVTVSCASGSSVIELIVTYEYV